MEIQLPQYHLLKRPSIFMTIVLVIEFFWRGSHLVLNMFLKKQHIRFCFLTQNISLLIGIFNSFKYIIMINMFNCYLSCCFYISLLFLLFSPFIIWLSSFIIFRALYYIILYGVVYLIFHSTLKFCKSTLIHVLLLIRIK